MKRRNNNWSSRRQQYRRVSTLGAREAVSEYRHKMVLCSHLEYPPCDRVHSYSISPCQRPFWNMTLAASTQQWTAPDLTKTVCTVRPRAHTSATRVPSPCPNSSVGTLTLFTGRVFDGVLWGDSTFWVCRWNPMMWPFKWNLSACTYTWCYLFVKILENEIWKFDRNLPLASFGSERVKRACVHISA